GADGVPGSGVPGEAGVLAESGRSEEAGALTGTGAGTEPLGTERDLARERFLRALSGMDRCFIGTIHSFCARLLRERPLEAGVPPNFQEISGTEEERFRAESWTRFLDRVVAGESRLAARLARVGLRAAQLKSLF